MAQDHATEGEVGGVAEPRSVDAPVKVEEERDIQVDPNASEGARDMIFQDFKRASHSCRASRRTLG
mgnify:CR=1 FL=1